MSEAARTPGEIAQSYRELRTRELSDQAAKAVGAPVIVAARFKPFAPWWVFSVFWKIALPIVGWFLLFRDWVRMRRVDGIEMLAVDEDRLYAIGGRVSGEPAAGHKLIRSWELAEIADVEVDDAGTDDRVSFEVRGEGRRYILFCSSLRTNPWASELVRRIGGAVPEPLTIPPGPTADDDPSTL